jgi:hypothetical protein
MSRKKKLDTLLVIAKLSPFLSMDFSDSVRKRIDNLRTNVSDPQVAFRVTVIW